MIRFFYSLMPVVFRAISMSFLSFVSQKRYSGEFLRPEVILSRSYLSYFCIWRSPLIIINLWFFKTITNSELLGVSDYYFQSLHISMIPTTSKYFQKIHEVRMTSPRWFSMELPVKLISLLATVTMITVKMSFTHFHSSICHGNIFLYQNHAIY